MEWYFSADGQQSGPVTQLALQQLFTNGTLPPSTLVWKEGMANWLEASVVSEFTLPGVSPSSPVPYTNNAGIPTVHSSSPYPGNNRFRDPLPPGAVPSYLWQSICCLIFCCMPLGIFAIVQASRVGPALALGKLAEAKIASRAARTWCWWAFGIGLVTNLLYLLATIGSVVAEL